MRENANTDPMTQDGRRDCHKIQIMSRSRRRSRRTVVDRPPRMWREGLRAQQSVHLEPAHVEHPEVITTSGTIESFPRSTSTTHHHDPDTVRDEYQWVVGGWHRWCSHTHRLAMVDVWISSEAAVGRRNPVICRCWMT